MDKELEKLLEGIDGEVWLCKDDEGCEACESRPCLIEKAMREKSGAYAERSEV